MTPPPEPRLLLKHHAPGGMIHIAGADATKWLQGIVTADLFNLEDNAFWGLMLQRNGRVRCEVVGVTTHGGTWLSVIGGELEDVYSYLDSMILMDDVTLVLAKNRSLWALHGMEAPSSMTVDGKLVVGQASLRWFSERDRVFVVDDTLESEFLAAMSLEGLEPCSEQRFEQLRIAAGIPKWSVDYSAQDTPHHACLFGRAVATSKGCYIGQEVVCKTEMIGRVANRLTRLALDSTLNVGVGSEVLVSQTGESVGVVTSLVVEGAGPQGWAIARLKSATIDTATQLKVGQNQGRIVDMLGA